MYEVLIGFNVRLAEKETWRGKAGKVVVFDGRQEVRFEPGERTKNLPKLTNIPFLENLGAISSVGEPEEEEVIDGEDSG